MTRPTQDVPSPAAHPCEPAPGDGARTPGHADDTACPGVAALSDYRAFVVGKLATHVPTGIANARSYASLPCFEHLFPFQRDLVIWALFRGRAALFTMTGTGKTRMQGVWAWAAAEYTGKPSIVFTPLAVADQTVAELSAIGIDAVRVRNADAIEPEQRVYVTNIERAHLFDPAMFGAVVIDESSILKASDGATRKRMTEQWVATPFRLCCSATPSPNDVVELGQHAEFLGICSAAEMRAEYFVHDGGSTQDWRLKGHARQPFWRFIASWAALVRSPADLGYDASAYVLPPLDVQHHVIDADQESVANTGLLFAQEAATLMERRAARRGSIDARVKACADLVNSDRQPWVVWCLLNDESDALAKAIPDAVEIRGSNTEDEREEALRAFTNGDVRVLISKSSITGAGLNWQFCARMAFVGIDDSFERYFQAVRRCWRFGQKRSVEVHLFSSMLEGAVLKNLQRKEVDFNAMADELSRETAAFVRAEVLSASRQANTYEPKVAMRLPEWLRSES